MRRFTNWLAPILLIALVAGFFLAPDGPLETGLKQAGIFWWVVGLPWIIPAALFVRLYMANKKRQQWWADMLRRAGSPVYRDTNQKDQSKD